ncbi:MAG: helicase C-terminal domain-containing protein [Fidelibacterota bacterium]
MLSADLFKELHLTTFIAFDFETTGLDPEDERIIEIAAIKYENGKPVDEFITLVNPGREIIPFITEITGISNAMVADSPGEEDILDEFLDFLSAYPLVAHNISFDIAFLNILRKRYQKEIVDHDLYDTLGLARCLMWDMPAFNLGTTAEIFGLDSTGSHRAGKDAENCGQLFPKLIEKALTIPFNTLSRMVELTAGTGLPNQRLYENLSRVYASKGIADGSYQRNPSQRIMVTNIYTRQGDGDITSLNNRDVFGKNGLLSQSMDAFEERPNQIQYAGFVTDTLQGESSLGAVEAGTGLGKSMAYLFPALKKATERPDEGPVIISCYTRHLQDQLFYKDLPMLADALDIPVQAVVLKGRRNYICKKRFYGLLKDARKMLSPAEIDSLLPVLTWLDETRTGDLSECNGFWSSKPGRVISMISSDTGFCTTPICSDYQGCFFGKVRQAVYSAQVIVVNHALLLTEMDMPGYLPEYNSLILDEGHNIINAAYQQLTRRLDRNIVQNVIRDADPTQSLNFRWVQTLEYLGTLHESFTKSKERLFPAVKQAGSESQAFFGTLAALFYDRYNANDAYVKKHITHNLTEEYGEVRQEFRSFVKALSNVQSIFNDIREQFIAEEIDEMDHPELRLVIDKNIEQLEGVIQTANALLMDQDPDWVYWQEGRFPARSTHKELEISLNGAPVNVSQSLADNFFGPLDYGIITSATLQVDDSFSYFLSRVGLDRLQTERVRTHSFESPFYYEDQVKYFQYGGSKPITGDARSIASVIHSAHKRYDKRILALFTAHATLNAVYQELRRKPGGKNLPVFAQGFGTSRYALVKGMSSVHNGILLGTNSFWEGIDLPGDLLEILIITKLPFDVPSEPIIKAYSEEIKRQGGNSFMEFSIPECIIKFRQGFGRLIRTTSDEGIFIVLDNRIITKRYGRHFRDAIPVPFTVFSNIGDLEF